MSSLEQSKEDISDGGDIQELDFLRKSPWTDCQLEVEGKPLHVARSFLSTISPVFRLMFASDFNEKNAVVLPLPDKKHEDVLTFLQCTNPRALAKVNYDNISGVLPLAHEYQVQRLLDECKKCLLKELLSIPIIRFDNNCRDTTTTLWVITYCEICVLAEKYGLDDLLKTCVEKFSSINAKWFKNVPMFKKISIELQIRIFRSRLHRIEQVVRGTEGMSSLEQSKEDISDGGDIQELDFLRKSPWTDIQLEVEGKSLYVARSFLSTISPVFQLMFESNFKEKNADVLPLPDKKYEDVLTFLQCTNTGALAKVKYDNISGVLPLAHEYQVQRLVDECKMCMLNELFSIPINRFDDNCGDMTTIFWLIKCCEICDLAEKYDLDDLLEICVERFANINAKWYKHALMFKKISRELQIRIFCSRLDQIEKAVR